MDIGDRESSLIAKSVVWTPIPLLSWVCPALGHVGVTDSRGVTYDFQGPGTVGEGQMIFGDPRRFWKVDIDNETWDVAIDEVSERFGNINYDLFCSNCHYFVASVLDHAGVEPVGQCRDRWSDGATVNIASVLARKGRNISTTDTMCICIPFIVFAMMLLFFVVRWS